MRLIEISDFKKIRASTQRLHFILSLYSHLYGSTRQMVTTARRLKERLFIGRKAMTNLDSMLKSRDIILLTKVWLAKAMVFPVVIYGCKSWTDHKEDWAPKNWCFQTVVLEKTVESPLDCKEIKQSILKEINSEYSLEGLMLKLKYFDHLMH